VVHDPELIILDEPFSGFDPVNAQVITNEILELNRKGATIIFSTHRMESVEQLCDSIALIHKSRKILEGKVKDIKNQYRNNTFRIGFSGTVPVAESPLYSILEEKRDGEYVHLTLQVNEQYTPNDILKFFIQHVQVTEFTELVPSMNDIFIQTVKH